MDCTSFRKYIGPFADGELEVEKNRDVLEHVRRCPACSARVEEVRALKNALVRISAEEYAPSRLRDRIVASLDAETDRLPGTLSKDQQRRAGTVRFRLAVPLGMAAALLLTVFLWHDRRPADPARPVVVTVMSDRTIADARIQHWLCVRQRGANHHREELGRDPATIARRLSERLGLTVIVPDYTARGFELVGADECGIQGRPGAHALYKAAGERTNLSVFTIGRVAHLGLEAGSRASGTYFVSVDGDATVVAWHHGRETYLLCGALPQARMLMLASDVRVAAGTPVPTWGDQFVAAVTIE